MDIVYCIDEKVLDQMERSAETVKKFNPDAHVIVISESPLKTKYDHMVRKLPNIPFRHSHGDRLSDATYMRMFLPEWLNMDKVLYLDADTLCTGKLDELFQQKIEYIGACHSHNFGIRQAQQIGIKTYALDSVLLLNLNNLRKIGYTENAIAAMQHGIFPKTTWYCAETLLNCCFSKLITFLDLKWNFCVNRNYDQYLDAIKEEDAVILHFIGPNKDRMKEYYEKMKELHAL
jgi:lipopolysaccharide biosynthesis glycosyltransferase